MKTAIYFEEGIAQIVLTPETVFEKSLIRNLEEPMEASIYHGSFYGCNGGWIRQTENYAPLHGVTQDKDKSLIVRLAPKTTA